MPRRTCTIHQPAYWPHLGLFDKIARSDVVVFLDDVQFSHGGFQNRNRLFVNSARSSVSTQTGWLSLPIRREAGVQDIANARVLKPEIVMRKHYDRISQAYSAAAGFGSVRDPLRALYVARAQESVALAGLGVATIVFAMEVLGIKTEVYGMSSTILQKSMDPTQRLIDICRHVGADSYLAGAGGRNYMRVEEFERQGVGLLWQSWSPFSYGQVHSPESFVPHLSCLDFLLNHGSQSAHVFSAGSRHSG